MPSRNVMPLSTSTYHGTGCDATEYSALIEKLLKEADPDNDGTLDEAELKSAAGQKLLLLIS